MADAFGGITCRVEQGRYGHRAKKATWLYAVLPPGQTPPELRWGFALDSKSEAPVSWCGNTTSKFDNRPRLSKKEASATPPAFLEVLLSIARACQ